jgi:SAM-dependent methyltransferase
MRRETRNGVKGGWKRVLQREGSVTRAADQLGIWLGQRDALTPPHRLFFDPDRADGSHDVREFVFVGEWYLRWLMELGLESHQRVLEVGSGFGRIALPLSKYLGGGSYEGIEITRQKVEYARRTISQRHANFRFTHADLFNKYYNAGGRLTAAEYRFPFADTEFDYVFLISVFTHMLPTDMEHYIAEIARVLKPSGRAVISYFLGGLPPGDPFYNYSPTCYVMDLAEPEHGVQHAEAHVQMLFERSGLAIDEIYRGSWREPSAASPWSTGQDMVVADKDPEASQSR